jgi:hypothetical protein
VAVIGGALLLGGPAARRLAAQGPAPDGAVPAPGIEVRSVSLPPAEAKKRAEEIRRASEREFANPPADLLARRDLRGFDVEIDDATVRVEQAVRILDKRPGMRYFWKLVVTDRSPAGRVVLERATSDRPFTVPDTRLHTSHADRAELPPGTYLVEMRLYEWPPGVPLARLADPKTAQGFQSVTGRKVVTIPAAPAP